MTAQAGDTLNIVLSELCQTYDFAACKKTYQYNFNPSQINYLGQAFQNYPADYLRSANDRSSFYVISGVPYPMIHCDPSEFDQLVQQAGLSNYPVFYTTNMSLTGDANALVAGVPGTAGVPVALFWEVPSGAYPVTQRYYSQMPDIATPASSAVVPWFPNQNYLITRVAGELMKDSDDERAGSFLTDDEGSNPLGAGVVLRKYLKLKDDTSDRVETVKLDRRRFGTSFDRLRNTKQIGW
jgi:hypothetical protein